MESLKEVIMKRDNLTSEEADELIQDCKDELIDALEEGDMDSAERMVEIHFGLEPDYLEELMLGLV